MWVVKMVDRKILQNDREQVVRVLTLNLNQAIELIDFISQCTYLQPYFVDGHDRSYIPAHHATVQTLTYNHSVHRARQLKRLCISMSKFLTGVCIQINHYGKETVVQELETIKEDCKFRLASLKEMVVQLGPLLPSTTTTTTTTTSSSSSIAAALPTVSTTRPVDAYNSINHPSSTASDIDE